MTDEATTEPIVVDPKPLVSTKGSLKGYSFKKWFARNKDKIKNIVTLGGGIAGILVTALTQAWIPSNPVLQGSILGLAGALGALVTSWLCDLIDFWSTEVDLEEQS